MQKIYIKLINEEIDILKPVFAKKIDNKYYIDVSKNDSDDEELEFNHGDKVRLKKYKFSDGTKGLIAIK